jgi:branched-chain amino acid transport system ATP-binding protein
MSGTSAAEAPMLAIDGVSKRFDAQQVLDRVTLNAAAGEVWVLLGPNGAGKSTLLNVVAGFLAPSAGEVRLDGRRITGMSPDRVAREGLRKVFQSTRLWESLSVYENLLVAWEHSPSSHERSAIAEALELTGLRGHAGALPSALSAGQRRILAIALALIGRPRVLLLDEPSAALDPHNAARVFEYIRRIDLAQRVIVLVEHNLHLLDGFGDRAAFIYRGEVRATGSYDEIVARADLRELYLGLRVD